MQISPASGVINPTRCLSKTLLPPPLRPMIASVSPVATSRSTPRKICCCPIFLANDRTAIIGELLIGNGWALTAQVGDGGTSIIARLKLLTLNSQLSTPNAFGVDCRTALLVSRWINDVEEHREEEIANQNCERRVNYRFGRRAADTDCAFARAQSFLATNEYNQNPKTECF